MKSTYRFCKQTGRGEARKFLEAAICSHSSECIIWPYSKKNNGYPDIKWQGRMHGAHRLACESRNGKPPSATHEAAHSCNNRACINPSHLRWATHKENHGDRHVHGTIQRGDKHPNAKLTPEKVRAIRALLKNGTRTCEIAQAFSISVRNVSAISTGTTWGWLT